MIRLDSKNVTARLNLGVLKAMAGDMQAAIPLLQSVFEQNESVVGIAKNLAEMQCRTTDVVGARGTLEKSLQYNPGLQEINQMLMRLPACSLGKSVR